MSEAWRRKTYYRTRVLVDVDRVLSPQFGDSLLCITGAQLEMLRNLTQYLHRRSTFVAEYEAGTYLTAEQEDWDAIQAIVADLEDTLMGCEDITTQLTAIASQLSCLCSTARAQNLVSPGTDLIVRDYLDDGTLVDADDYIYSTPPADERCEIAQVTYWQAWEVFTETLLPLAEATSDVLMGLILAALASVLGATVVGIPAATVLAICAGLGYLITEGTISDFTNAYRANEEELICAVYRGLETSYREAERQAVAVMEDIEGWSGTDQIMAHMLFCPWAMQLAKRAIDAATPKALSFITTGYCSDCNIIEGNDWWALYLPLSGNTVEMVHPSGSSWVSGCWEYALPSGYICQGVVLDVLDLTACDLKRMSAGEASCTGSGLWGNQSAGDLTEGQFFCVNGTGIDEENCKAALCPTATDKTNVYQLTGPLTINGGFHLGYTCEGEATIHVKYIVFQGSPP